MNIVTKATITVSALLGMAEIAASLQATVQSEAFKGDTGIASLKVVSSSVKLVDGNAAEVELVFAKADAPVDLPEAEKADIVPDVAAIPVPAPVAPIGGAVPVFGLSPLPVA